MNNNDNLNGTVLGNTNTDNLNSVPNPNNIENLDGGVVNNIPNNNQVLTNPVDNLQTINQPTQQSDSSIPPVVTEDNTTVNTNTAIDNNVLNSTPNNNQIPNQNMPQSANLDAQVGNVQPNVGVTPQPQSQPAYTNPQIINPTPMPGFENPEVIGTTPPISLEEEKQPKKKGNNKILFIIIILIVLAAIGFGTFYVLKYTDLLSKNEGVTITTKNIELNVGDSLTNDIKDFATISGTSSSNCTLNTLDVDVSNAGTYEYTVTCGKITKTGQVIVTKNKEIEIATKKVYKVKDEQLSTNINDYATISGTDIKNCTLDTEDVDITQAGTYNYKITCDSVEGTGELVILEYKIKGYLVCTSKEQTDSNLNAATTISNKFAIVDDGNNSYGNIASEINNFKFNDEEKFADYLADYNINKTLTLNNVTGDVTFDNENMTISISRELDEDTVKEYGEDNIKNYSSLRKYFTETKNYTCTYQGGND